MNRLFFVGVTAVFLTTLLLLWPNRQTQAQTAVPTPDRLAAPPTVPAPTQADEGAQLFWLHCQPCHGDQGQGLTDAPDDDWRAQYPMEDQFCWNSGCHGERPYENGFILPRQIPAVIGEESLHKFATATDLHNYVRAAMPLQAPATLADDEYWAIVAFLAQAHDAWQGVPITAVSAQTVILNTPQPIAAAPMPTVLATAVPPSAATSAPNQTIWLVGGGLAALLIMGGAAWLKQSR